VNILEVNQILLPSSSICKELIKWGVSKLLALGYTIQAKPQKAAMILQFRYYVSLGLLGIKRV